MPQYSAQPPKTYKNPDIININTKTLEYTPLKSIKQNNILSQAFTLNAETKYIF